jgi:diguanylate cyclase (GGDEF)-like protein/PAS domain S-box-containing protein
LVFDSEALTMRGKASETLRRQDESLEFANSVLSAAMEGSPDGILIVRKRGQIVSYNEKFYEMWQLPRELADAPTDTPLINAVLRKLKHPDAFMLRVAYLYDHPEEASQDLIELKDGRVFDRHSRGLYAADRGYIGRIWFFRDITEAKHAELRTQADLHRTQAQLEIIGQIGQSQALLAGDVEAIAREITELASRSTGCERVNVWLFNEDETELRCIDLFEATPARHSAGMTLSGKEFGNEIAIIKASRYVNADNALTDPRTAGYVEPYLKPLGITSMLDAVIQASGRHFGLLCFEHVDQAHQWTQDEIAFVCQLADKVGIAVISRIRRQAEAATRTVERLAGIGGWDLDVANDQLAWSEEVYRLFGLDPRAPATVANFLSGIHPDDLKRVQDTLAATLEQNAPYDLQFRVVRPDKTERIVHTQGEATLDRTGKVVRLTGTAHDITERKTAELALWRRDALLHALAVCANEFVTAPSLDEAMPKALALLSKTMRIDRMVVLDSPKTPDAAPSLRYVWQSADIAFRLDQTFFDDPGLMTPEIVAWQAPLFDGRIVMSNLRDATGDLKAMLERIGTKTIVLIPIMIDGGYWGQIALESCKGERVWADVEIEALQTLGDLIVNSIRRERYVSEITNANRIVLNSPTILYRLRGEPSLPMIYVSQNVKLFGHDPAVLMASPRLYRDLIHPEDAAAVDETLAQIFDKNSERGVFEFRMMTGEGDYRWVENQFAPIRNAAGRVIEIEGLLFDITERKAAEAEILHLARTDPLTGLANRATFFERLQQAFAASRRGAASFALLSLDIDRFKDVNDTLGHPAGDQLLTTVAERLEASVRESDIVARLGGDEFAILQYGLADTADAGALAIKIRSALAMPMTLSGNELHLTASIGISIYAEEIAAPDDMLSQADVALYRAKEEGRDQYRFHTEELDQYVREQVSLTRELETAISREEFELHYRPHVEVGTGKIVGMEALVRWRHPARGLLMPSAFLAMAERSGVIVSIGRWVLDRACRQMSLWRRAGIAPPTLAVNIAHAQIKGGNEFVQFVTQTLEKWGLGPGELQFDIAESMLARAAMAQNDVLGRLRKLGIRISIDEFGTKNSTLDHLRRYRVNCLKIPRPLIDAAPRDPDSAAMVRAIIGIARELNIEVIAQGVETQAQWTFLTTASPVSKVQGFYSSEPVPAGRAAKLLRRAFIR